MFLLSFFMFSFPSFSFSSGGAKFFLCFVPVSSRCIGEMAFCAAWWRAHVFAKSSLILRTSQQQEETAEPRMMISSLAAHSHTDERIVGRRDSSAVNGTIQLDDGFFLTTDTRNNDDTWRKE